MIYALRWNSNFPILDLQGEFFKRTLIQLASLKYYALPHRY